jgi:hypothetical protein
MRITATQIAEWAKTKEAQSSLPRLVRRLVHAAGTPTQVAFPAGDSTDLPGWDGELASEHDSPWVPKGKSFWEFSCEAPVTRKANGDYKKRTRQPLNEVRTNSTFVFVSARRWSQKARWLEEKRAAREWVEIRAYDADDLEQWLEQSPAVALQFAEALGIAGPGVESVVTHWEDWSQQSDPAITAEAFFIDRESIREQFIVDLRRQIEVGQPMPYAIRADSMDEATAFVCAALLAHEDLACEWRARGTSV